MSVHVCVNFTDKEIAYIRDNYKVYTVKEMAKKLGRPVSSVRRWCYKLQESGEIPKKRQARKPDNLDDRFKNPLLRVAVNRTALPDDWTPINRLDELWKYEGRWCKRISALEEVCEK